MALEYLTDTLTASATSDMMLDADQGEAQARFHDGRPSIVTFAINTTGASNSVVLEVFAGSRQIVGTSALPAGGTAGVFPALDQTAIRFPVAGNEILRFRLRETAAATPTVNLLIDTTPIA